MWSRYNGYKYCFDCNYVGTYAWFTKEECDHCPNRYFKDGQCTVCPANSKPNSDHSGCVCNDGYYMSNGTCRSCTDKSYATTTEEACYATCPNNTRMWSNYHGYKYCFDCNYAGGAYAWFTKEECSHCPNRYFKDGACNLCPANANANENHTGCVCNDGYYFKDGKCSLCPANAKANEDYTACVCNDGYAMSNGVCCPSGSYWNSLTKTCTSCLANYGQGEGACTDASQPWCNPTGYTCQACPSDNPYWHNEKHACVKCFADYGSGKAGGCTKAAAAPL